MDQPDPTAEQHEAMIQRVIEVGQSVGTPTGVHVMDAETALARAEQGIQFLAIASDLRLLTQKAQDVVQRLRPEQDAGDVARY